MQEKNNKDIILPQSFDSLKTYIAENYSDLPKRLNQAVKYALNNPDDIALGTTTSIAKVAGVQPSTLVRLAKYLGYDGFSDFQSVFRDRLRSQSIPYKERFKALDAYNEDGSEESAFLNGFFSAARKSLDHVKENINIENLKQAVATLARAETIYIVAKRRAFPLAAHLAYTFGKLKMNYKIVGSVIGNDDDLLEMGTEKDAAIAICFSPYAPETISQVKSMEANKIPIVAITDSPFSPLATHNNLWFESAEEDYAGFRSLSAGIALTITLAVAVAKTRLKLENTPEE